MRRFMQRLSLAIVLGAILFIPGLAIAQAPVPPDQIQGYKPVVARVFFDAERPITALSQELDIWEVQREQGYVVALLWPEQITWLHSLSYEVQIDEGRTAEVLRPNRLLPGQTAGIPGYPCYRTVEETFTVAQAIATSYPGLATWVDMGDSWEKTQAGGSEGYDLSVLRLTNEAILDPKPKLFVMTSVHAREYAPAELGTRFAEYLVENYNVDADVTWLLDYHEIHLLLQANPDGRKHAELGKYWRKNTNENYCSATSDYRGADLNRNFVFQWACCGGSSGDVCSEVYRGPTAGSEPETQAIQDYVRAQFPDQRADDLIAAAPVTATGVFLDIHSYGELVLWPWGFTYASAPNGSALQTLGRKLAFFNGYEPAQAVELYPTDGTTDDFAYGELGLAAYTFEVGTTTFFQDCATFENTILPDNLPALLYAAKAARTPYITPSGPDTLGVMAMPSTTLASEFVHLTATVSDARYSNQNGVEAMQAISAAEYYINAPPWVTTTMPLAYPMMAVDGAFDEPVEDIAATLDPANLVPGRNLIFVRGQDAEGNWGAFSATFVNLADPPLTITPHPIVADIIDQVNTTALYNYVGDLSGEWEVVVGGTPYTLTTRHSLASTFIATATQYAYEHFTGLGLPTSYHTYTMSERTLRNVIAEQPGLLDPGRILLVTAHVDSMPTGSIAPGADDNASGSAAVLVAADILSQYNFPYTLRYVLFTGEEQGLVGSKAYATEVAASGEDLVGVLNMDMIAYNSDTYPAPVVEVHTRSGSAGNGDRYLADVFADVIAGYDIDLIPEVLPDNEQRSDHSSFWQQGYSAILTIEDFQDFTPYYHTTDDQLVTLDMEYFTNFTQAVVGSLVHLLGLVDFTYTPDTPRVLQTTTFTGVAMLDTEPVTYTWDFGDGEFGTGAIITHTYPFRGDDHIYTVVLTATTPHESTPPLNSISIQKLVSISGAEVDFTYTPTRAVLGEAITFTGNVTPTVSPLTYSWNFGDSAAVVTDNPVTHTFVGETALWDYMVTMTATHPTGMAVASRRIGLVTWQIFLPLVVRE